MNYVIYDGRSGRILATHSRLCGETGASLPMGDAEVLECCGLPFDEQAKSNVRVLAVEAAALRTGRGLRVDPKRGELVARHRLELSVARPQIRGDGDDSTDVEVRVLRSDGKPDASFEGRIKVSTQRGRLSEPGGVVQAKAGVARIVLRSVPETIDRVRILGVDVEGEFDGGRASVDFL